jgi:hypothetical protein
MEKKDDVNEFLKKMGMKEEKEEKTVKWHEIVKPESVAIILGRKGFGKSALAYWLCDDNAKRHNLLPVVINLPRERQPLLPDSFVIRRLDDIPRLSDAAIIIDEGTTMLPAGEKKLEELVKAYVALSRQRNQLILFIFHSSSDVGSRILRGVDAILLKEPSQRQIQHGSKDNWWRELLVEAKERFEALQDMSKNPKEFTYIDSEEPEFRGMLQNPLPDFWSEDLSKAWAGVNNLEPDLFGGEQQELLVRHNFKGWRVDDPEMKAVYLVSPEMERRAVLVEEHPFQHSGYVVMEDKETKVRWVKQVY